MVSADLKLWTYGAFYSSFYPVQNADCTYQNNPKRRIRTNLFLLQLFEPALELVARVVLQPAELAFAVLYFGLLLAQSFERVRRCSCRRSPSFQRRQTQFAAEHDDVIHNATKTKTSRSETKTYRATSALSWWFSARSSIFSRTSFVAARCALPHKPS